MLSLFCTLVIGIWKRACQHRFFCYDDLKQRRRACIVTTKNMAIIICVAVMVICGIYIWRYDPQTLDHRTTISLIFDPPLRPEWPKDAKRGAIFFGDPTAPQDPTDPHGYTAAEAPPSFWDFSRAMNNMLDDETLYLRKIILGGFIGATVGIFAYFLRSKKSKSQSNESNLSDSEKPNKTETKKS